MVQLQKVITAVGMFSIFEAMLQDGLACNDGFRGAKDVLEQEGELTLKERFGNLELAINVLKHGRGWSHDKLVKKSGICLLGSSFPQKTSLARATHQKFRRS